MTRTLVKLRRYHVMSTAHTTAAEATTTAGDGADGSSKEEGDKGTRNTSSLVVATFAA